MFLLDIQPEVVFPKGLIGLGLSRFDESCFSAVWWTRQLNQVIFVLCNMYHVSSFKKKHTKQNIGNIF